MLKLKRYLMTESDEKWSIAPLDNLTPIEGKPDSKFIEDFSKLEGCTIYSTTLLQKQHIDAIQTKEALFIMRDYYIEYIESEVEKSFAPEKMKYEARIAKIRKAMYEKRKKHSNKIYKKHKKELELFTKGLSNESLD